MEGQRIKGQKRPPGLKRLEMRRGDARAIAASHQHAILALAQVGNAHGEPNSDRGQRDREGEGGDVRQHALAKIVGFIAVPLIARQIIGLVSSDLLNRLDVRAWPPAWRLGQAARPEFEHAMLVIRRDRLLVFHGCQLRGMLILSSTLVARLTENVDMARMR